MNNHTENHDSHHSAKGYIIGLILSLLLTLVPFGMLAFGDFSSSINIMAIIICAIAQLLVQAIFFLHMSTDPEQMWITSTGVYMILIVLFFVIGSIWIFTHLDHNMLMGH